ncbi:MAG: MBOAT family protein [Acetatifactor sp.]|nr:MBOAT family protein [Acetatifactor sp.]
MLFNSFSFLIFFPVVLAVLFVIPRKLRYIWLLVASYYFYMCWNVKYVLLLFGTTAVTYLAALLIEKAGENVFFKKFFAAVSAVCVLGLLGYFKYADFAIDSLNRLTLAFRGVTPFRVVDVLLPMGISFYVFQALGYCIDVYRGDIKAEKNPLRYALFISFFPQLVAGPIERAGKLMGQLNRIHEVDLWDTDRIQKGALTMLYGFFMKMVIADRASVFVNTVFDPETYGNYAGLMYGVAAVLFSIQIYCDFAGYTYIAIGSARVMGVEIMDNFHTPYLSLNIRDFWDRWHISLSKWFRDYLYFPLGGSRKGKIRKYINIFIVFLLSGLWHGAAWHFVLWGAMHGILRIVGEATGKIRAKIYEQLHFKTDTFATGLWQRACTFFMVTMAWVVFRAESIGQAKDIIKGMFSKYNPWIFFDGSLYTCGLDEKEFHVLIYAVLFMILADVLLYRGKKIAEAFAAQNLWFKWLVFVAGICFIAVFGVYGPQFQASQFIYFQF